MVVNSSNSLIFPALPLLFDSVFDDFIKAVPVTQRYPTQGFPVVDHYVDEVGNSILEFALAGYKAEELKVSVEGSKLIVSAEAQKENKEKSYRRIVRKSFSRSFTDFGNEFDLVALRASYVDGILRIEVPRKEEAKPKEFKIETVRKALK